MTIKLSGLVSSLKSACRVAVKKPSFEVSARLSAVGLGEAIVYLQTGNSSRLMRRQRSMSSTSSRQFGQLDTKRSVEYRLITANNSNTRPNASEAHESI